MLAAALAIFLTTIWTMRDWAALSVLHLPGNDDMMRLAEIRDWLNGQGFNDLMQYRLGPPGGAPMHWSRLADMGPALLVTLLTPLLGRHGAEVAMSVSYPGILFFFYLLLIARLGERLGGKQARTPALLLGALAYPTIGLFIPGRLDHHDLQIVLTLVLVDMFVGPASLKSGIIGGIAAALSLAVGLEVAPEVVAVLVVLGIAWLWGSADQDRQAVGFGAALGGVTLVLLAFMRPHVWPEQWCDGFTPSSTRATLALAAAWLLLGFSGRYVTTLRSRIVAAGAIGAGAVVAAALLSPVCLEGPYGSLNPFLQRVWMANVGEALPLTSPKEPFGWKIEFGGLSIAGFVAALLLWWRGGMTDLRWKLFTVFLGLSVVALLLQMRVSYILGGLSVLPFAVALGRDSAGNLGKRLLLWAAGAGMVYYALSGFVDRAMAPKVVAGRAAEQACTAPGPFQKLAQMPKGTVMAPITLGSYLIGATQMHAVAAGYHRNNIGNLAMYQFFLARPERAQQLARRWHIDYVALCPGDFTAPGLQGDYRGSLAARLEGEEAPPDWLIPVDTGGSLHFYRIRHDQRLSKLAASH
ncbi:hypothetical protein GCM10023219_22520 [Stakelama sediminis]